MKNENDSSTFLKEDEEDKHDSTSLQLHKNPTKDEQYTEKESKGDINNSSKVDNINKGLSELTDTNQLEEISDNHPEPISFDIQDIERISNQLAADDPKAKINEVSLTMRLFLS